MCGIVGVIRGKGSKVQVVQDIMSDLLVIDTIRGFDSTGIFGAATRPGFRNPKGMYIHKCAIDGASYVRQYRKTIERTVADYNIVIGHNRAASIGDVTSKNAHPFQHDHIIGVHNGTLRNKFDLDPEGKYNTDSSALLAQMSKYGDLEGLKKASGSLAVAWYNKNTGRLNLTRNKARPLFFSSIPSLDLVVIASELEMIQLALGRQGIEAPGDAVEEWYVEENTFVSFDPDKLMDWSCEYVNLKPIPQTVANTNNCNGHHGYYDCQSYYDDSKWWKGKNKTQSDGSKKNHKENKKSEGKRQRVDTILKEMGLKHRQHIEFYTYGWESYHARHPESNNSKVYGIMTGCLNVEPFAEVVVHGISEVNANKFIDHDCVAFVGGLSEKKEIYVVASEIKISPDDVPIDLRGSSGSPSPKKGMVVYDNVAETGGNVIEGEFEKGPIHDSYEDRTGDTLDPIGPDGEVISLAEFDNLTRGGCVRCTANIWPEESEYLAWTDDHRPYCPGCVKEMMEDVGSVSH